LLNSGETLKPQLRLVKAGVVRRILSAHSIGDPVFSGIIVCLGLVILALLAGITTELIIRAMPSIRHFGFSFLSSSEWDPASDQYGALPFIYGTAVSSGIALVISVPLSLGVALCLSEVSPQWLSRKVGFLVELLAAIPSVVYGLWAIFVLGPWLRDWIEPPLSKYLGFLPLFAGPCVSVGMLTAGVVLAIMVLPYIAAVCTDVFRVVPQSQREAALALGATKWEMIRIAVLPYGASGVVGAIVLGLGRALGETIAVAMVIGNRPVISVSLFAPSSTLASVIANEFVEAMTDLNVSALIELGLVLLVLGLMLNVIARVLVLGATQTRLHEGS
jgi:phosphate transport system permease protein